MAHILLTHVKAKGKSKVESQTLRSLNRSAQLSGEPERTERGAEMEEPHGPARSLALMRWTVYRQRRPGHQCGRLSQRPKLEAEPEKGWNQPLQKQAGAVSWASEKPRQLHQAGPREKLGCW